MSDLALDDYPKSFTREFVSYCQTHRLPPQLFHDLAKMLPNIPRYVRIRPCATQQEEKGESPCDEDAAEPHNVAKKLAECLNVPSSSVRLVEWLPKPYYLAIPRNTVMSQVELYRRGVVSAMDAASVAAVVALRPRQGDVVWDVCCSPGMKLSLMADAIGESGIAIGSDINVNRIFSTRAVMKKHKSRNVCLILADGTTYSFCPAGLVATEAKGAPPGKCNSDGLTTLEERWLRRIRKRQSSGGKALGTQGKGGGNSEVAVVFMASEVRSHFMSQRSGVCQEQCGFDRVLVDAECSHDGSLAHIFLCDDAKKPFMAASEDKTATSEAIDNEHRMRRLNLSGHGACDAADSEGSEISPLQRLQLGLLKNGYAQLKPGGTLVYSTCSFTFQQNEQIVREMVRSVNACEGTMLQFGGEAVLCPPFSYAHEAGQTRHVSPIVALTNEQLDLLQQKLKMAGNPYEILPTAQEGNENVSGVRLWPHIFNTSFQFISKIWKKPPAPHPPPA